MEQPTLELVHRLCEELRTNEINYCHWKSNAYLDRSANGSNDLDLLISRADIQSFTEILGRLDIKQATGSPDRQMPGVLDYYGFDKPSDKFVHVHAHYQLVVGHDATKNYHLPIESGYLESATQGDLFKVPAPEFELILLVTRMIIKHSTWDVIFGRQGKFEETEIHELEYLQERVSQTALVDVLENQFPWFGGHAFFNQCALSVDGKSSAWFRIRTAWKLQQLLSLHTRRSQIVDVWLKKWRWFRRGIERRVFRRVFRKRIASSGLMIAIVGGDGAGKTTAIENLYAWFTGVFDTTKVHMGKPQWSRTTVFVRGLLKIGTMLRLYPFSSVKDDYYLYTDPPEYPGIPWLIRHVCAGRDRYLTYARARRFATNGGIVICDRFPLAEVKLMDGPQVERMAGIHADRWIIKLLARIEKKYYRKILHPDLLAVLRADPEISVERKTDENPTTVRVRAGEIWNIDWQRTSAHVIDASQTKDEVLSALKSLVWSNL